MSDDGKSGKSPEDAAADATRGAIEPGSPAPAGPGSDRTASGRRKPVFPSAASEAGGAAQPTDRTVPDDPFAPLDIPDDYRRSLRTIDRQGRRKWVYAEIVTGAWQRRRLLVALLLGTLFFAAPWVTIGGQPLLQLDLSTRKIVLLGQIFWLHELNLFLTAFLGALIGIFALTAYGGRVFCGWLCPHSTLLEHVFRPIEALIEGRAAKRRRLDSDPASPGKLARKTAKWTLYAIVAFLLSNQILALFVGGPTLLAMIAAGPFEHPTPFLVMVGFLGALLFNFGWFREQTCLIVCPYGRLQAVLLDRQTLVVGYDARRGEPRGRVDKQGAGDCIDCRRCVVVCPTGIDIRDGIQLECIGCLACADACDDQMRKVGRAPGLVGYTSEAKLAGEPAPRRIRPYFYAALCGLLFGVAAWRISHRRAFDVTVMRSGLAQATVQGDIVQNYFRLRIENKTREPRAFAIEAAGDDIQVFVPPSEKRLAPPEQPIEAGVFVRMRIDRFEHGLAHSRLRVVALATPPGTAGATTPPPPDAEPAPAAQRLSETTVKLTLFGPEP